MIHRTIDGDYDLTTDELIFLVMKGYKRTARIPSRGVWGYNKHYASASGVLRLAFGLDRVPGHTDLWTQGFDEGFEYTGHYKECGPGFPGQCEYEKGFWVGVDVGRAIFSWPDSPNIHSVPE